MDANQLRKRVEELIELEKRATGDGGDYYDYMRVLHDSAPTLLPVMLAALDAVEAARCIHHWHDTGRNNEGMIVSAEHVRKLWASLARFDAAVAEVGQ